MLQSFIASFIDFYKYLESRIIKTLKWSCLIIELTEYSMCPTVLEMSPAGLLKLFWYLFPLLKCNSYTNLTHWGWHLVSSFNLSKAFHFNLTIKCNTIVIFQLDKHAFWSNILWRIISICVQRAGVKEVVTTGKNNVEKKRLPTSVIRQV